MGIHGCKFIISEDYKDIFAEWGHYYKKCEQFKKWRDFLLKWGPFSSSYLKCVTRDNYVITLFLEVASLSLD